LSLSCSGCNYLGADKSLARPGRKKKARKHVRDARDFNNIERRAVIRGFSPLQGKAPKEIHATLTETLACFIPGRAKDLSAPLYRGADKSLARSERKQARKHVREARFQQHRDASSHQVFFPARQGAEGNSRHSDRNISVFPS
jgi:hypothetical protein